MSRRYPHAAPGTIARGEAWVRYVVLKMREYGVTLTPVYGYEDQIACGDTREGFEIKLDETSASTGRFSFEIAERTTSEVWHPSGICSPSNARFYVIGSEHLWMVFVRRTLLRYYLSCAPRIYRWGHDRKFPTLRRFFLPFADAADLPAQVICHRGRFAWRYEHWMEGNS